MVGGTYIGKDMKLHPCECRACVKMRYEADIDRHRIALRNAKTCIEAQTQNASTANALAIIDGVLGSPDYVP